VKPTPRLSSARCLQPLPAVARLTATIVIPDYSHGDADLNARKEAVMASVRNELALANAQELMNVRSQLGVFPFLIVSQT
jgi:hypothetical protein